MSPFQYVRELLRRRRIEGEIDEELQFHVEMETRAHVQAGVSPAEARRVALRDLGGLTQAKDAVRELRRVWPEVIAQDARYGVRRLTREPGFAATAILILAIGVGSCTAMFSIVQAVLLRPLGIDAPHRVVMLWTRHTQRSVVGELSYKAYQDLRAHSQSFDNVAIVGSVNWSGTMTMGDAEPVRMPSSVVSATFFDVLGARPLLGRTFRNEDDQQSAPRVLVLSHAIWLQHFGGDAGVIGRRVTVREEAPGEPFEIIGVMSEEFFFPRGAGYWTPAAPRLARIARRAGAPIEPFFNDLNVFYALGRLASDVTVGAAAAESGALLKHVEDLKDTEASTRAVLTPLLDHIFGRARNALWVLMAAVVVVLLVTCTNVAGLLFARGASRMREMAVRAAIGADRRALIRQVIVESAVMASVAAALGVAVAALVLDTLVALSPADIPRLQSTSLDGRALAFALAATVATTLLVGLVPALHVSRPRLGGVLKSAGHTVGHEIGHARVRRALMAAQLSATFVLVVAAALCVNSFSRLSRVDLGFDPTNVLTFQLDGIGDARYPSRARRLDAIEELLSRFGRVPGVVTAGAVYQRPFEHGPIGLDSSFVLEGQVDTPESRARNPILNHEAVTRGYFGAIGIRLLRGRLFDSRDNENSSPVVIVSEAMATRVWPGADPIGKRLRTANAAGADGRSAPWQTVVGVVATARHREIETPRLELYVPFRQSESNVQHFTIRTTSDPLRLVPMIASELSEFNKALTISGATTMEEIVRRTRGPWRFNMLVFSMFGGVALVLAAVGLFALVAYEVAQRSKEIALRIALGAAHGRVVRLMIMQGAKPAAVGLAVGLLASLLITRTLSSLLFEVAPTDSATFAGAIGLLVSVVLMATYLAARRAASVDPQEALKDA